MERLRIKIKRKYLNSIKIDNKINSYILTINNNIKNIIFYVKINEKSLKFNYYF